MSGLISGAELLSLLPRFLAVFAGCVVGTLVLAWLCCLLLCRKKHN